MDSIKAERAGPEPAEDSPRPTILAIALYGPHGWRARNGHLFSSDASLRWVVAQHRGELVEAGAVAMIGGRIVGMLPLFDEMVVRFGREALGYRQQTRQRAADHAIAVAIGNCEFPPPQAAV